MVAETFCSLVLPVTHGQFNIRNNERTFSENMLPIRVSQNRLKLNIHTKTALIPGGRVLNLFDRFPPFYIYIYILRGIAAGLLRDFVCKSTNFMSHTIFICNNIVGFFFKLNIDNRNRVFFFTTLQFRYVRRWLAIENEIQ